MQHVPRFFPENIDTTERRRVTAVIVIALLVLSLPYLWVLTITPQGYSYGGLLYNPDDQNVHLAWAKQAPAYLTIRDLFTTESLDTREPARFVNLFCYVLGTVAAVTHLPPVVIYHLLRLIGAAFCLLWFYLLCSRLTDDKRVRLVALLLAAFSLGSGWLLDVLPGVFGATTFIDRPDSTAWPMMPEAFTFTSAFVFPLNIASMALLVYVYLKVLEAQAGEGQSPALKAALAAFLLTNMHTYDAIPLAATLVVWTTYGYWRDRDTGAGRAWLAPAMATLGMIPSLLYQAWVFRNSQEFSVKALTPTPAPPVSFVLHSYALLLFFAIAGVIVARRQRGMWLPFLWTLVVFVLIYAPVSFARKMIEGLHLPLCLLAAMGLCYATAMLRSAFLRRLVMGAALILLCASSAQFVIWCLHNAQDNNFSRAKVFMPPLYLTAGDAAALRHLDSLPREGVVLALPFLGNYVPRETGDFTYVGHWAETLKYGEKLGEVGRYYTGSMTPAEAMAWLRSRHIRYVVEGYYEHQFSGKLPSAGLGLKPIFNESGTMIYEVEH